MTQGHNDIIDKDGIMVGNAALTRSRADQV